VYEQLLKKVKPYLADTTEWHVQLSKDLSMEFQPVEKELVIKTYAATAQLDKELPDEKSSLMYLRIISVIIQPNKLEQFEKIYDNDILPALRELDGCRFAFMTESSEEENTVLCVSLWESKQYADAYEKSGLFEKLKEKTKHTFSEFFRWKMTLEKELGAQVTTSADMKVDTYRVVTGKSFK
jgi:heme-degrading monooxygenase HmoA